MQKQILLGQKYHVEYYIEGTGPSVVFVHGFTENPHIWENFTSILKSKYTIIRPALPGHGRTDLMEPLEISTMAEVIYEVLRNENITRATFVGHSMGGYALLYLAEKHPELFKGLCLFHSTATADSEIIKQNRQRAIDIIRHNHASFLHAFIPDLFAPQNRERLSSFIQQLLQMAGQIKPETLIACQQAMMNRSDKTNLLQKFEFPFAFILGKQDPRLPLDAVHPLTLLPKTSYVLILENCGHMGYIEEPEVTMDFLDFFITKTT